MSPVEFLLSGFILSRHILVLPFEQQLLREKKKKNVDKKNLANMSNIVK